MITRNRRWTALALAAMLTVSGAACGSDSDDDAEATTTTAATEAPDTEGAGDEGEMDEGDEGEMDEADEVSIAPLDGIDPCSLIAELDVESVIADEEPTFTAESTTALPDPFVTSDAEPTEAIGCGAWSSTVTDAGILVRVFRFESADDAAAAAETLLDGEELAGTQADVALINRFDMPTGFSYTLSGSIGDVLVVVQAQSVPDLTDPATQVSTLNGILADLQAA
jgi:hypothetical protein